MPRIAVVIPHLNQPDLLARCLASLSDGRRAPDEVVVVDNGSDVLPEAVVAGHPGVRLIEQPDPGPGPARNAGIAATTGDIVACIDADCLADPDWLAAMETAFEDPQAQVLGGDVRIALVDPERLTVLEAYESEYAYRMDRYIAREGFTGTGNLGLRREVFAAVGPFAGLSVAEDRDWGQRAVAAGYALRYVPEMRVYHPARPDFAGLQAKWDRQTGHDFARYRGAVGRVRWGLRTAAMAVSPLAEVPRILRSDRIERAGDRLKALRGLTRIRLYRARIMTRLLLGGDPDRLTTTWNRS